MAGRTRATLRGKWWQVFFSSIKYCFKCGGKLSRVYVQAEGSRRHVCKKCGEITYLNPKVVAGAIPVNKKGEVLLLRRNIEPAIGYWTFPAGYQELGETVVEAAIRETWEETKVRVKAGSLRGIYSYEDAGVVTIVFDAKVNSSEKPCLTPESQEVKYFPIHKIPWKELAFRSTIHAMRDWVKAQKKGRKKK